MSEGGAKGNGDGGGGGVGGGGVDCGGIFGGGNSYSTSTNTTTTITAKNIKKFNDLYENCPSNRPNQNCDYLLIFCPSIPTAGQTIKTKYCYL